jgi:hypothetical protein
VANYAHNRGRSPGLHWGGRSAKPVAFILVCELILSMETKQPRDAVVKPLDSTYPDRKATAQDYALF